MTKNSEIVTIQKMVNGGYGLSKVSSGQIILVQHALPQETINVSITETKKNYLLGRIKEVIEPHPGRLTPPCPYFGQCGGCNLQHCQYSTQLEIKKTILSDLLYRQKDLTFQDDTLSLPPPLSSPTQFGYRQRIRLQIGKTSNFGFFKFRSHDIVPVKKCLLATAQINHTLSMLGDHPDARKLAQLSHEVELLQNPATKKTVSIIQLKRKPRAADINSAKNLCRDLDDLDRVFFKGSDFPLSGPYLQATAHMDNSLKCIYPKISDTLPALEFSWEVGGFSQVNLDQNRFLIELVARLVDVNTDESVLDLFCGMGNFSIPLAFKAKSLLGIEGQGAAIRSAKNNALRAGLGNTAFEKANVHKACVQLAQDKKQFDITVLDPPRQGVPALSPSLAKITRKKLIYISCDPATLCRDLAAMNKAGFTIRKIQSIDMFPQTHHLETVVLLDKN